MSIKLMSMVWDIDFPTSSQKLVLLKIADHSNDEGGNIWPSKSRIARQTGTSESTVQSCLKVFRDCGILHVDQEGGKGPHSTTRYRINLILIEALSKGICYLEGCSDVLELYGEIPPAKGLEIDPLEGVENSPLSEKGVNHRPLKGSTSGSKGSTVDPKPSITIKEPSSAPAGASVVSARLPTLTGRPRAEFQISRAEPQWDAWMQHLAASNLRDLREAAEHHGLITVVGSRWPNDLSPAPKVQPIPGLSERSKAMSGEGV